MSKTLVFVYGTLKQGFSNHNYFLGDAEFLGRGVTTHPYYMKDTGGFPVVLQEHHDTHIKGEAYYVHDDQLEALDRLESNGNFFERREIDVDVEGNGIVKAWMYFGMADAFAKNLSQYTDVNKVDGFYNWREE